MIISNDRNKKDGAWLLSPKWSGMQAGIFGIYFILFVLFILLVDRYPR